MEILGQVYEQFLGKVIRLTLAPCQDRGKARGAQPAGAYYTPLHCGLHR